MEFKKENAGISIDMTSIFEAEIDKLKLFIGLLYMY